jgi:FkbM family methyltransferase
MKQQLKNLIKAVLERFDVSIVRQSTLSKVMRNLSAAQDLEILLKLPEDTASERLRYLTKSQSQIRQDLFVLSQLQFKRGGYFVEFGATNGVELSNTYLLEKEFGWTGILAEPAHCYQTDLKKNRSCHIETECVWSQSGEHLSFNEVEEATYSTIHSFSKSDAHQAFREAGKQYEVTTISLNDLLAKYHAPQVIDYLSIDTEGSEYQILSHFDFSKHRFRVITCEHNYTPMRQQLFDLLSQQGYQRVFEDLSMFDDWYIGPDAQD